MKLLIVGQPACRPCVALKNQIMDRINDLVKMGVNFEYIDLNELEDKDTFIQKHGLTSTPTTWIVKDGQTVKEFTGYIDVDTLFETMGDLK